MSDLATRIGYSFAAVVSGNNQPCMSGDPRDRIPPIKRRHFDDACDSAAREIEAQFCGQIQDLAEKCETLEKERDRWQSRVLKLERRLAAIRAAFHAD